MNKLSHPEFISFLIALGTMLVLARLAAELARLARFPIVAGEILVGIILGPSILGEINPDFFQTL
jgi:Kef-type K+ transport system membrane component KefB